MKYVIRHQPAATGIAEAGWHVWRPGMYQKPFRGFKSFASVPTLEEALQKVDSDILEAMVRFAGLTEQADVDLVEAGWWWSAHNRNAWRDQFFSRKRT